MPTLSQTRLLCLLAAWLLAAHAFAGGQSPASQAASPGFEPTRTDTKKAREAYQRGLKAEKAGDWQAAFEEYGQAASQWSANREFLLRREIARFRLVQQHVDRAEREALAGRLEQARGELITALGLDPDYSVARERLEQLQPRMWIPEPERVQYRAAPVRIVPAPGPRSFDFRGDTRGAYEEVARQFGVKATFDDELRPRQIRFRVAEVDFETAMRLLEQQTSTFWVAVDQRTFFVADSTLAKRQAYAPTVVQTVLLPESATSEQMTETLRIVRDILGITHAQLDPDSRTLTLRAPPENVALAVELIQEVEQARGELMLDIQILEVDRSEARRLGFLPPSTGRVVSISPEDLRQAQQSSQGLLAVITRLFGQTGALAGLTPEQIALLLSTGQISTTALIPPLVAFGGGRTLFFATLPGAAAEFSEALSLVRHGRRVLLRASDGQAATFFIGERFPISFSRLGPSFVPRAVATPVLPTVPIRSDFPTGNAPASVAVGDFNRDARLDMATANRDANTVSILLGKGDGTFGTKTDFSAAERPVSVTAGDFNADGKLDLAVANETSNTVSVLLGNGDGTFSARTDFATGAGPVSVIAADFNHDGKLDVATTNRDANTVSILLGNGDGTFGAKIDFATSSGPASLIARDFNGDQRLDLAVANRNSNTVSILLGNGDGTFGFRTDFLTGTGPVSLTAADFNRDGKFDLAIANQDANTVTILLGNGDGTFFSKTDFATGEQPASVTATDFDVDGKLDLAVGNQKANTISILLGNGDGSFRPRNDLGSGRGPSSLSTGDFNTDGTLDLAVSNARSNTASVFVNPTRVAGTLSTLQAAYPAFQYEDLGLKVRATPRLHPGIEVTLQLQFEIRSLAAETLNDIPIISNRTVEQTVRLKENEPTVLAGFASQEESLVIEGWPALSRLTGVAHIGGRRNAQKRKTELLIVLTPRRLRLAPRTGRSLYAGREPASTGAGATRPPQ